MSVRHPDGQVCGQRPAERYAMVDEAGAATANDDGPEEKLLAESRTVAWDEPGNEVTTRNPSIRVLPFLLFAAFFMHAKAFPLSASAGTALPPWPITIALVVAVVIALADGRGPVDKCCGDLLAVQPMATSWAKPPITADGSAVPHTIPPWVIADVRGSHNRKCRDWFAGIKRCDTDL